MVGIIGFGEAGRAFASGAGWTGEAHAFDIDPARTRCASLAQALCCADVVLSLVTADQALAAADAVSASLLSGALFLDMNSVSPDTKRAARDAIERAGGHYVDVAIMAPVEPARLTVPLLLSGPHAAAGAAALVELGFGNVRSLGGDVGTASAIKMIRSVMVKGIEALTAEMMAAANAAGVADEVLASLGDDWATKSPYNLERIATHGARRAAEMEEAARTLASLGVEPVMTQATVVRQRDAARPALKRAA